MNKQISLSGLMDELSQARTKKKESWEQMERLILWGKYVAEIRPCYYSGRKRSGAKSTAVPAWQLDSVCPQVCFPEDIPLFSCLQVIPSIGGIVRCCLNNIASFLLVLLPVPAGKPAGINLTCGHAPLILSLEGG